MRADHPPTPLDGIDLLPLPPLDAGLAAELAERLSRRVDCPVRLAGGDLLGDGGAPLPAPRVPGREQADADALLARLESLPRASGRLLLGVTPEDVGNPVFTFFFGRARQHGHAALVALARLDPAFAGPPPDRERLLQRATCEALHELGHLGGLHHCPDASCVMHFAPAVEDIDLRGAGYCAACAARLPAGLVRQG